VKFAIGSAVPANTQSARVACSKEQKLSLAPDASTPDSSAPMNRVYAASQPVMLTATIRQRLSSSAPSRWSRTTTWAMSSRSA